MLTLLLLLLGAPGAQEEEPAVEAPAYDALVDLSTLDLATLEAQAQSLYAEEHLLSARKVADELLERDPDNVVGHFIAGVVWREAEGNHARAIRHLGRARELLEQSQGTWGKSGELHAQLLNAILLTAQEMEEYEYELLILDFYNSRYNPPMLAERAWPLMKLERWDEAREATQAAIASMDPWQQSLGHNTLCALESLAGDRKASYEACLAALAHEEQQPKPDITVDAFNASLSATAMLKFEEAEKLALRADTGSSLSSSNPHVLLVWLFLTQGRGEEAVASLHQMQAWRARQPPHLRDQARAGAEAALALTLLVAGQVDAGMLVADRVMRYPDRLGLSSGAQAQTQGSNAMIRIAMRESLRQRRLEAAAARGWFALLWERLRGLWPDSDDWTDRATVRAAVTERDLLVASLRPHLSGSGLILPSWLLGDLVDVLGFGVVDAAARAASQLETTEGFEGYFQAISAEVAWARGDEDAAVEAGLAALEGLPAAERLLRARVALVLAQAEQATGQDALPRFAEAYSLDPGVFRRMGVALPARVELGVDGDIAELAAKGLERSPRLKDDDEGFVVSVEGQEEAPRVCLRSPEGNQLRCAEMPPPPEPPEPPPPKEGEEAVPVEVVPPTDAERAAALVMAFHDEVFAMPLGLKRLDRNSLDGATVVAEDAARERLQGLLDNAAQVDPR